MTFYPSGRVYDALPSKPDVRDHLAQLREFLVVPDAMELPSVPVLDQGHEGACVGHGCAGARETLELLTTVNVGQAPSVVPLSRAFIYYEARKIEGTTRQDAGAEVRDGCKVLQKMGVCTEAMFPYNDAVFAKNPSQTAVRAAAKYRISTYTRLTNSEQVRTALAMLHPVVIGISVYPSFEGIGRDGLVPMPDTASEQLLGGHCVFLCGYHPDPSHPGKFLYHAQNSWGASWGDGGRMYFPAAYLDSSNLTWDLWSIAP